MGKTLCRIVAVSTVGNFSQIGAKAFTMSFIAICTLISESFHSNNVKYILGNLSMVYSDSLGPVNEITFIGTDIVYKFLHRTYGCEPEESVPRRNIFLCNYSRRFTSLNYFYCIQLSTFVL